jgi:hypothetical protein
MIRRLLLALLLIAVLLPKMGSGVAQAASCVVTYTDDSGPGTLREKLADPTCATITFNLPGSAPWAITLANNLPTITRVVSITGPGASFLTVNRSARTYSPATVFSLGTGGDLTITGLTLTGGYTGIYLVADSSATVSQSILSSNGTGLVLYSGGTAKITNSTISGSDSSGLWLTGDAATATISNSTLSGNPDGLFFRSSGTATVTNSTISGSTTGGLVFSQGGMATLSNSTLSGNYYGLDFALGGTATISNSTLSGNTEALYLKSGSATVTNSTFSNNGIGLDFDQGGTATVTNSTLSGNTEGLYFYLGGTTTLTNTVAAKGTNSNCTFVSGTTGGTVNNGGHDLADDATCFANGTNTSTVVAAGTSGLDPTGLKDNGGPTQTIALLTDSPAIDGGDDAICAQTGSGRVNGVDQRGASRTIGAGLHCDIGAYERPGSTPTPTPTPITPTPTPITPTPTPITPTPTPITPTPTPITPTPTPITPTPTPITPTPTPITPTPTPITPTPTPITPTPTPITPTPTPITPTPTPITPTPTPITPTPTPTTSSLSVSPTSLTFGLQHVGTTSASQTVTLTNTGGTGVFIDGLSLDAANPNEYQVGSECGKFIPAGGSCIIDISFKPTYATANAANVLSIAYSVGGSPAAGSPLHMQLNGSATNRPLVLTVTPTSGGTVTPSPAGPYPLHTLVTLQATPNPGYTLTGWTFDGFSYIASPTFNIYMDSDHTVAAMFVPTSPASAPPTPTPPAPAPSFADVPTSYWAYTSIAQFAQRGITTGCDTGLYCPDRNVTRAEMAVFLDRALGHASPPPPTTPTFADVPQGYWAYAYIEEFAQLGITTGCGTNDAGQRLFCPDRNVTRAEMAVFLDRAKGYGNPTAPASATFSDVPASYWAYVSVEQFAQLGITTGCGTDAQGRRLYCPDRNVTRAEMAVFVIRAFP